MDRLDSHKDNWREAELKIDLGTDLPLAEPVNLKVIQLEICYSMFFYFYLCYYLFIKNQGAVETPNGKKNVNIKSTEKKDPNLPKRPANPFFRFCQEQRPIVLDQIIMSGEGEPTKQDLTKRLAITWNTMEHNDKKVCTFNFMCLECLLLIIIYHHILDNNSLWLTVITYYKYLKIILI